MGRSTHLDPLRWIADHQMHVEVSLGQIFAHARDDRGANREVGHEVAVLEGSREGVGFRVVRGACCAAGRK